MKHIRAAPLPSPEVCGPILFLTLPNRPFVSGTQAQDAPQGCTQGARVRALFIMKHIHSKCTYTLTEGLEAVPHWPLLSGKRPSTQRAIVHTHTLHSLH